jgi:GT2 family glycosyltransferase
VSLPSLSVVITTYQRRDALPEVVRAIAADPHPIEIVVVVDGCADGSYELLGRLAAEEPRLRPVWRENGGDCAARQTGVEAATGDVVLMLDDDVVAGPGLATGHARAQERLVDTLVLGYMPTTRPARRRPGTFTTLLYANEYEQACRRYEEDPGSVISGLWAGNLSMRRADALRVGLSGPRRLGYHDDQEFGLRCARAGLTARFDRSLAARHAHVRDLDSFLRQARLAGLARRHLAAAYPDLVKYPDPAGALPAPVRLGVGLAAGRGVYPAAAAALRAGVRVAGRVGLFGAEINFARILRQVELTRGYRGR